MRGLAVRLLAALSLATASCGVDQVSSDVYLGTAVLTYFDPNTNFGAYRTYAIVNQIAVYRDAGGSEPPLSYQPAPEILGAIESNLNARGYVKVAEIDPLNPPPTPPAADLAINVAALLGTSYIFYPCDWWGYWGYPGFACDYPYQFVPYKTGALLIQMGDLKNAASTAPNVFIPWTAVAYSVLTPSSAANTQIAVDAVNQAFAQSPYLHTP